MSDYNRTRRLRLIREAEGYVELMTLGGDRWALSPANRDRLGARALAALAKLDPHHGQRAHALLVTGLVYRALDRYADAIGPLVASSELESDNLHTWLALGWCYKRLGRVDLAIGAMDQALVANDQEAIVHYNLACYWGLRGHAANSVRALAQAFELEPEYRDRVANEADFSLIRSHPDFQALVSSVSV